MAGPWLLYPQRSQSRVHSTVGEDGSWEGATRISPSKSRAGRPRAGRVIQLSSGRRLEASCVNRNLGEEHYEVAASSTEWRENLGPGRRGKASTPKSQLHCVTLGKCCSLSGPSLMGQGWNRGSPHSLWAPGQPFDQEVWKQGLSILGICTVWGPAPSLLSSRPEPCSGSMGSKPGLWQNMISNRVQAEQKTAPRVAGRASSLDWSWQDPLKFACILEGKLTGGTSNG